jgi:transcription elongation GreA/GreB family factor
VSSEVPVVRVKSVVMIRNQEDAGKLVTSVEGPSDQGLYLLTAKPALGGALLGWGAGEEVEVITEAGVARFKVLSVSP